MTVREKVWLEAWTVSRKYGIDTQRCSEDADACLNAFDEKFPEVDRHRYEASKVTDS